MQLITNKPYTDGPNGSGQYTDYIYYIDRHLPGWLRSLAPKTALEVHEESWNAYPYTKTKFSLPFVEKFQIHLETLFIADSGNQVCGVVGGTECTRGVVWRGEGEGWVLWNMLWFQYYILAPPL